MKNILFLLIFFSSASFGQGMSMTVFSTSCNCWVNKNVYETSNPPATIAGNAATATTATTATTAATLATPRTINGVSFNGSANITVTSDASTLTGLTLNPTVAVTESQVTNLVTDLAAKQGLAVANTSATTGTMTTTVTAGLSAFKITPTGACTFNASGGTAGQRISFIVTTSGVSSFVLTWGTNFRTTGTLATGTTTAKKFCVSFLNEDNTVWVETGRTTAL